MDKVNEAIALMAQGFNCSQAVFATYRNRDILDEQTALKLATIFGAGTACTGTGYCGALSGALMVLSLHHGRGDIESVPAKGVTYRLGQQLLATCKETMGSVYCEEILGINISTPENLAQAKEQKLFETRCVDAVRTACLFLEDHIEGPPCREPSRN